MNTRSIVSKLTQFQSLIYSKGYDIVAITETWLSDNLLDHEILPTGYSIYCKDHSSRGGGVLLAVKNSIPSHALSTPLELEALYVQIGNTDPINYCLVYIPPSSSELYIQTLCDFLISCSNDKLVLIGDFNFPTINWDIYFRVRLQCQIFSVI